MKIKVLNVAICLAVLAGALPMASAAEAAENGAASLRRVVEQPPNPHIKKMSTAQIATVRQSDLVSRAEIRRGVRFSVPGQGEYELLDMRSAAAGVDCKGHIPSLIKAIAQNPPTGEGPQWLNLTIYDGGPLGTVCLAPLGGSCYKMIRKVTP